MVIEWKWNIKWIEEWLRIHRNIKKAVYFKIRDKKDIVKSKIEKL